MGDGTHFPLKTAFALVSAGLLLLLYRQVYPGQGISPSIFPQAARVSLWRHPPSPALAVLPQQGGELNHIQQPQVAAGPESRVPVTGFLIDDSGALDPFFAALHQLQLAPGPETPAQVVTILHYGDSPTTADLITGEVRTLLQQRFGDAGRGYLLAGKPWAWYGHDGIDLSDHGWEISNAVGKGREEVYGMGGASFSGGTEAGSHILLKAHNQRSVTISYLGQPDGGDLQVLADGKPVEEFSTASGSRAPQWQVLTLPAGTKAVDLKPVSGQVRLFGEDFRTGSRGLLYDSLGLNGASTSVLSNGFDPAAWGVELAHEKPALVIINYGTNESGYGSYVDKQYEPTLRTAIARIRAAVPGAAILVMSPMDRGRRTGVDEIETYDTIPRLVATQRRVAAELHCAFFDTFDAMGGSGTMARWYTAHPRLVAGDLIHPTPQGASLVAQLFVKDLSVGYDQYVQHAGTHRETAPGAGPSEPPPPGKPAAPVATENHPHA